MSAIKSQAKKLADMLGTGAKNAGEHVVDGAKDVASTARVTGLIIRDLGGNVWTALAAGDKDRTKKRLDVALAAAAEAFANLAMDSKDSLSFHAQGLGGAVSTTAKAAAAQTGILAKTVGVEALEGTADALNEKVVPGAMAASRTLRQKARTLRQDLMAK